MLVSNLVFGPLAKQNEVSCDLHRNLSAKSGIKKVLF